MPESTRKLAAIVFTDIVGFTKLSAGNEPAALALLEKQRDLLKPIVEKHGGSWLKEIGDGLLLSFETTNEAVHCAIEMQQVVKEVENLNLRIGIHQGEVVFQGNDVIGDDVNIAARIEPFAAPGGVAISGRVNASLERDPDFETHYLGQPQLKGVSQTVKAYCITSHGLPKTDMSKVNAKLEPEGFQWNVKNTIGIAASMIGLFMLINFMFLRIGYADKDETPSIAILPFENKGAEADEFYAYGISSDLIADVTSAGMIRVASLNDVEKLDYKNINNSELAKDLFVRYVAKGTLWKMDSVFQLSMEIFDTKESKVVYTKRWQTDWTDLATIKDDLSDNILETLEIEVLRDVEDQIVESNPEAYEYYLKAQYKYDKRKNIEDTEIARGLLRKAIEMDDNLIKAKLLIGYTYKATGDNDEAMDIYISALNQSEKLGDKSGEASSLNSIGSVHTGKGDYDKALDYYGRSLAINEDLSDKSGEARSLNNIGIVYHERGDLDKALDYYKRSLVINEELGDKSRQASSLNNIGIVHHGKGDYDKALDYIGRSLVINEELGDNYQFGNNLNNIGNAHADKGDLDKALDYYKRSLLMREELGDKKGIGYCLFNIGLVHADKGELDKALNYYKKSLEIDKELSDKYSMGISFYNIGNVYYDKGEFDTALEYLEKCLSVRKEIGLGQYSLLAATTSICLTYKNLGKEYDEKEIRRMIKELEHIDFRLNFSLYELLDEQSYLETAYNQIQEKVDVMENDLKQKFLSYPIQKKIIEEYNKIFS